MQGCSFVRLPNANVERPFVGDKVLLRGLVGIFDSPMRKDGKKLFAAVAADGLPGLPSVIGSIV